MLQIDELTFAAKNRVILDKVTFSIKEGELVVIVGPNGGGKSSLVKIIAGIYATYNGSIVKKEGLKIAYMPQHFSINPYLPLRVKDFLLIGHKYKSKINWIIEILKLENILPCLMSTLSGGELKRAILGRCLMNHPDILILDEPTANMDINAQNNFYGLIKQIKQIVGCSIIMISHDLYVVMKGTDRVICLKKRICCEGNPASIVQNKHFIEIFGNSVDLYKHHH